MALEDRLAAISTDGKPVGAGLLIDDDLVLTCAHVVNAALGRDLFEKSRPAPKAVVSVRVHGIAQSVDATIDPAPDGWRPPPASKNGGDLCILQLPAGTAKGRGPAHLREWAVVNEHRFHAAGYPENWGKIDYADGTLLGTDDDGLYMLASEPRGKASSSLLGGEQRAAGVIYTGFSGGPVESDGEIIGLMTLSRAPKDATSYATPASAFGERFEKLVVRYDNRVAEAYPHESRLRKRAEDRFAKHLVHLDLRMRYCDEFAKVLDVHRTATESGEYVKGQDLTAADVARAYRRKEQVVLLHAPGGAGKSSFLLELLLAAPYEDLVPFLLDFSAPGKANSSSNDPVERLIGWFNDYGGFGFARKMIELANDRSTNLKPLLVIDGLNQISDKWDEVLPTITTLSNGALSRAVIVVSDRMVDRGTNMEGFDHAVIPPLAPSAYKKALEGRWQMTVADDPTWRPILTSPIFLNLLLKTPESKLDGIPTRFQLLMSHFRDECGLSQDDLRALADFAFDFYRTNHQTAIPLRSYEELDKERRDRVEDKGLIHDIGNDTFEFRHQILHDALAALKVASATEIEEESLLRGPAFEVLSLKAASGDAIELAVEALLKPADLLAKRDEPLEPREFLAEVFDWNYWITLQCVAGFDRRGYSPLPRWVRHAIYSHNLVRRFDPFLHTATRAQELRKLIPASEELTYLDLPGFDEMAREIEKIIRQQVEKNESEEKYKQQWLNVFLREKPFTVAEMSVLWSDPIIAWTAANALRRFANPREVTDELIRLYELSRATSDSAPRAASFRWRLVHALGNSAAAHQKLFGVTFDRVEDMNVRYGAVRSLIELAVTQAPGEDRDEILGKLQARLKELFQLPDAARVRKELRRCCAFNELHVVGRLGWREEWLGQGLKAFTAILRTGKGLAEEAGLRDEAAIWGEWADAAESMPGDVGKWDERETKWLTIITKDK
jgi:Predicted NTPase (NACHT family)